MALSGSDVLIGAQNVDGGTDAAYLYDTAGNLLQTFVAQDQAGFANSWIALSGSDVLVGSVAANGQTGVAQLYSTSGKLLHTFTDPQAGGKEADWFGGSVSISGSNVLIGAEDTNNTVGVAYLYSTSGTLLRTFQDPKSGNGDFFGSSVVLSGTNVQVAALDADANPGVVYLFNTSGQLLQTFSNPSPEKGDGFGSAVALSGSQVLVGAYGAGGEGGAAYLYDVAPPAVAPTVVTNPVSQKVTAYQYFTLSATASGNPTPAVQWQVSSDGGKTFTNLAGDNENTITPLIAFPEMNGWEFRAVFSNASGQVITRAATLTVTIPRWMTTIAFDLVFLYNAYLPYLDGARPHGFQ